VKPRREGSGGTNLNEGDLAAAVARAVLPEGYTARDALEAHIALARTLEADPEFFEPSIRTVRNANGSHSINANFVAQRLTSVARERGPEAAVAWYRKSKYINSASGGAVTALHGVTCDGAISLSESVALIPFTEVPESRMRNWVVESYDNRSLGLTHRSALGPPTAALFRRGTIEPLTIARGEDFSKSPPLVWFRQLDLAAMLLALVPKAIPTESAQWFHYDDSDAALLCEFGLSGQGGEFQPYKLYAPVRVTADSVAGLLAAFEALSGSAKDRLSLALGRIIRSRRQLNPGNRAIDLAIALEVLFMNADRDEHSYKISLRISRLLRTSAADRLKAFTEVRKLYDMRSKMVHTGDAPDTWNINGSECSAHEIVENVDVLCTAAIRHFVAAGEIPKDWRTIELG